MRGQMVGFKVPASTVLLSTVLCTHILEWRSKQGHNAYNIEPINTKMCCRSQKCRIIVYAVAVLIKTNFRLYPTHPIISWCFMLKSLSIELLVHTFILKISRATSDGLCHLVVLLQESERPLCSSYFTIFMSTWALVWPYAR